MKDIILKQGTYVEQNSATSKRVVGFVLQKYILEVLSNNTCCVKDITANAISGTTITGTTITATTSIVTDTISERTAGSGVTIDGALIKDSGISANDMFAAFYPTSTAQALSGAGAVNITAYLTKYTSTGASQALSLANGTQIGQMKRIWHVVDGGSGILTPTTLVGGTTITFTTANEFADLIWTSSGWNAIELGNFTAGGASPSLS